MARISRTILNIIVVAGILLIIYYTVTQLSSIFPSSNVKPPEGSAQDDKNNPISYIRNIVDPSKSFDQSPLIRSFTYQNNGRRSLSFTLYGGLSEYFSKETHSYQYNPDKEVILELVENQYQDQYLLPLLDQIKKTSNSPDIQAKNTISLVQHMPYNWEKFYGPKMDWYYPYETLYDNKGVCADKSILLAYLLNKLGYEVVLFEFSAHMAVGVKCNPDYDFYDTGYAFIETTRPTIISYIPDSYVGGFTVTSNPHIIHLNGGTRSLELSQEYKDGQEMKQLENMGKVLDQYHYSRWSALSSKYDLRYNT